jgi:hypothetical protein
MGASVPTTNDDPVTAAGLLGVLYAPVLQPATTSAAVNSARKVIGKDLKSVLEFISVTSLHKVWSQKTANADKSDALASPQGRQ